MRVARFVLIPSMLVGLVACQAAEPQDTEGSQERASSSASALTSEQCSYFSAADTVTICHRTLSAKKPYVILATSSEGCAAHVAHAGDYVAYNDPTCSGQGCLPEGAPVDGTVECCDGLTPVNGRCQGVGTCGSGAPTVHIVSPAPGDTTGTSGPITFTAPGPGNRFECTIDGLVLGTCWSGSTFVLTPGPHTLTVVEIDSACGATSAPASVTWNVSDFEDRLPTVTINQVAAQPDPASAGPILFAVSFATAVTGFTRSDISFQGSTAGGNLVVTVTGSGANYIVEVTGMLSPGTVVASVPAGAAVDSFGSLSFDSTSTDNSVSYTP